MNRRIVTMIADLTQSKEPETLKGLASRYKVTTRTVRNDLNQINQLLDENDLNPLTLSSGGVIEMGEDFPKILSAITTQDYYSYKLSKEERKMIAAAMLISSAGYVTLASIADRLYVSRATIIGDLDEIKSFIKEGGLEVTSHPNKGLLVEGKESTKRLFLFRLSAFEASEHPADDRAGASPMISVTAGDAHTIRKILSEQNRAHHLHMTDSSFLQTQKYLGIMIMRNLKGEYIEPQPEAESPYREFAGDILRYISQYCSIRTTEDEIRYLAHRLSRCRYTHKEDFDLIDVQIQALTRRFIHSVSEYLQISLDDDYDFFENLSNHLQSMYNADASQFPEDPELKQIVGEHPDAEHAVRESLGILRDFDVSRRITENEIVYIIIHVCAALERKKNSEISFHVILACHAGIGTSQLLRENLKKHFNFSIVDIISSHETANLEPGQADLVISTVPLKECPIEYVTVSARLTDEDYLHIGAKIDDLRNRRHLPEREEARDITAGGVLHIVENVVRDKVSDSVLARDILKSVRTEIYQYFHEDDPLESGQQELLLSRLLPPAFIQLDVPCGSWRESIRMSALPLLEKGYITEGYIDGMIRNIEENGPYIVLAPGLAVPHDVPENGALHIGMNLIRLKSPVEFGAEELDPVEFVCTLSALDHRSHLKALFTLVKLFGDSVYHQKLLNADTPQQAAAVIRDYEYNMKE